MDTSKTRNSLVATVAVLTVIAMTALVMWEPTSSGENGLLREEGLGISPQETQAGELHVWQPLRVTLSSQGVPATASVLSAEGQLKTSDAGKAAISDQQARLSIRQAAQGGPASPAGVSERMIGALRIEGTDEIRGATVSVTQRAHYGKSIPDGGGFPGFRFKSPEAGQRRRFPER